MATILIIDDEENICTLLSEVFSERKHDVVTAQDGVKGLELAKTHPPDVVVLDIDMPGLDGYEVCKRLRANPATHKLPILMLTGKTALPDAMKGLATGADDYITKPFDVEEVAWRVEVLLTR